MNAEKYKEIMAHVDAQFAPQWNALRHKHNEELRAAQYRARQTHNSAAMLPAEAECYIAHAKDIVVARANYIAEAFTAFNEPAGHEANTALARFFVEVVGGRKAAFQGAVLQRQQQTRQVFSQLPFILRSFEREANEALLTGRAILDKQRVQLTHRAVVPEVGIKYVIDTCIFNWLADGRIKREALPSDGGYAITHIQVDEISATSDQERRTRLWLVQSDLHCRLLPTLTFAFDISRLGHAKMGDGRLCKSIQVDLDILNGSKQNNLRDALIAEVAIANGYALITADADLRTATEKNGGLVIFFEPPNARPI
jgi:predicted nucleic acid-binding protein